MAEQDVDLMAMPVTSPKRALLIECMRRQTARNLNPIMTEGYVRTEFVLATAGQSEVEFELRTNAANGNQPVQPFERRLDINDAFYVTHALVYFYTWVTGADAQADTVARAAARLQTFPNARVFGAANPEIIKAYNGYLKMQVDETEFIPSLDLLSMMFAGDVQEGTAVSSVATTGVTNNSNWENERGWKQLTDPCARLNGPARTKFTVKFPVVVAPVVSLSSFAIGLYLRGWKAQNSGAFRPGNM